MRHDLKNRRNVSSLTEMCFEITICDFLTLPLTRTVSKMCRSQINLQDLHFKSEAIDQMLSAGVWAALWRGERKNEMNNT